MAIVKKQTRSKAKPSTSRNKKAVSSKGVRGPSGKVNYYTNKVVQGSGDVILIDKEINTNGTFYAPDGYAFKTVTVNIKEFVAPGVTLTLTPSNDLLDKDVDTIGELMVTINIKKGTNTINNAKIFLNGTSVKEFSENISEGGVFIYTHTFDPRTNTTFKVQAIAYDKQGKTGQATKEVKFVNKTYYGTVAADVSAPSVEMIKALEHTLIPSRAYVYSGITMDFGKVVFAYPASFGSLNSIKDTKNNIDYSSSFTKTSASIDGTAYFVYTLTDPSAANDVQLTFA